MRKRWALVLIAVVLAVLAGRASTQAQKYKPITLTMQELSRAEHKTEVMPAKAAASPMALADPMGAVDAFLQRNRKEADDSIQALTREAEALRARLQKVEAALARWQGVAGALSPKDAPAPAPPVPEAVPVPTIGPDVPPMPIDQPAAPPDPVPSLPQPPGEPTLPAPR